MTMTTKASSKVEYAMVDTAGGIDGFIDDAADTSLPIPAAQAVPMISVVSPANLPGGYSFQAEDSSGQLFTVVVVSAIYRHVRIHSQKSLVLTRTELVSIWQPDGGVEEGQTFSVPGSYLPADTRDSIPVGHWRDDLCNCCVYGPCHNHCCLACWCAPLALAQVMVRMRLNMFARRSTNPYTPTFQRMVFLVATYWTLTQAINVVFPILVATSGGINEQGQLKLSAFAEVLVSILLLLHTWGPLLFWIYLIVAIARTRYHIRSTYAIPTKCCGDTCCEDAACAIFCGHWTTMQMARHTANYERHPATCCTENGLPDHIKHSTN
jgi:hypothetical protein